MSRTTQEEFCNIINERYNNQFEVLSEYIPKSRIDVKCNFCGSKFDVACDTAKYRTIYCPGCSDKSVYHNDLWAQNKIDAKNGVGNYKLISNYKGTCFPITVEHKCGTDITFQNATSAFYLNINCPLCDKYSKNSSYDVFLKKLENKYGDEFDIIGEYISMNDKLTVRHKICNSVFDITPTSLLNSKVGCRNCINNSMRTNHEDFVKRVCDILPDIEIMSEYIGRHYDVTCKCLICSNIWSNKAESLLKGHGCPNCSKHKYPEEGYNIWSISPNIAQYLADPEDGYKYRVTTKERLNFICPNCNSIIRKIPNLILDKNGRFTCPICSDGVSTPEKIVNCVLQQLGLDYIPQLSKKDFEWCNKYRYDFYIRSHNIIIEVHGLQHYQGTYRFKTYEEIHQNDINKKNVAISNGVADYIVIDAKKSDLLYIKNSILNSRLNKYFSLKKINWDQCVKACMTSLKITACNYWKDGMYLNQIAKAMKMNFSTIGKYLREMTVYGLCDYSTEESRRRSAKYRESNECIDKNKFSRRRPWGRINGKVKNIDTGIIYNSLADANKAINKKENSQQIYKCCLGCNETAYGYRWEFIII